MSTAEAAKELGTIIIVQALCLAVSLGLLLLLAVIYDAAYRSMSWFSNPWLLFGIYICPMFFCLGIGPSLYIMYRKKVEKYRLQCKSLNLTRVIMTFTAFDTSHILYTNVLAFTVHLLNTYDFDLNGARRSFIIYFDV